MGREDDFHRSLERAHQAWLGIGERARAARCAFWIALTLMLRGEAGQANAWLARLQRLDESREGVEHGYVQALLAEQLFRQGRMDRSEESAFDAVRTGESFGDTDVAACGRFQLGRLLICREDIPGGLTHLDEAMLAATHDELSPVMTGIVYCGVIAGCTKVYALGRAVEWTAALSQWCEEQPEMAAFTGSCLVHRAEVMQLRGAWSSAMAEAERARERTSVAGRRGPPAEAFYLKAELHRLCGEFAEAEGAYEQAIRAGSDAQPGLALLRLGQGQVDAAEAMADRLVATTTAAVRRASVLPAHVEIMIAAGRIDDATASCEELSDLARAFESELLTAIADYARGAVLLARGEAPEALAALEQAFERWQQIDAPYEVARTRVLLALACRALGDEETARLELDTARSIFERLGAAPQIAGIDAHRQGEPMRQHTLSRRELQVLRLLATGMTNRRIANELFLSERTIDRHVSNIYGKLGVSSRAAATAWAYEHDVL